MKNQDYVIYRNRTTKFKERIYFKRSNLQKSDFNETSNGYVFEENFDHNGIKISIKILLHSKNVFDLFSAPNYKNFNITGDIDNFSVLFLTEYLATKSQTICITSAGKRGKISYSLSLIGLRKQFNAIGGLKRKSHKKKKSTQTGQGSILIISHDSKKPAPKTSVPNHISWAISHPFQGGRVSPR